MVSKAFISMVQNLGTAYGRVLGVIDENAIVAACSDDSMTGSTRIGLPMSSAENSILRHGGYTYRYAEPEKRGSILFIEGEDENATRFINAAAIALNGLSEAGNGNNDLLSFVKNVVTDNILPSDIYIRARDYNFPMDGNTTVFVVRCRDASDSVTALDLIGELFPEKTKDFVFVVNETDVVIVKTVDPSIDNNALESLAASIVDMLKTQHHIPVTVGIGSRVTGIREMSASFKEARNALEVGKVFETEHAVVSYGNLGIARLIYQLPTTICHQFLSEIFKQGSIDSLDSETLFTIQRFFENNLNVSETSRGLFVHRNTLVYRLEKIKKITGLDLREFDQAIVFKVALMVRKYLDSANSNY